jgi:hypothetical protein
MLGGAVVQTLNMVLRFMKDTSSTRFTTRMVDELPIFRHDTWYLSGLTQKGQESADAIDELKELVRAPSRDLMSLLSIFNLNRNFTALPVEV